MVEGFQDAQVKLLMWKKFVKTYIVVLHRQSPDEVVCSGLLRFLENRKWESIYTILD